MSLQDYKRKRDFRKTKEPTGGSSKYESELSFVIQKHAASHLHYDFRLELNGTLKSWAVPKGPSLDPTVKSLAIQVEDHPLDYATFEGVIPQGQYGGGTVLVWDQGTWEPEGDPEKSLKEGKLKFTLHGKKLHGSWALVRMGGRAGETGKNWLLIKHRDEAAKPQAKFDVLDREAKSVLSGRDLDDIAANPDEVWQPPDNTKAEVKMARSAKPRASKAARVTRSQNRDFGVEALSASRLASMPRRFTPQLATLAHRVPIGDEWLHELKFDGYRILAFIESSKGIRLVTRGGKNWTNRFRVIADALVAFKLKNAILDGEVVALDSHGISNFQQLQNSMKSGDTASLVYYVFDLPYLNGYDLTQTPQIERKEVLSRVILSNNPANTGPIRYTEHFQGQGDTLLQQAHQSGMEGIVAKQAQSIYHSFRTSDWLKVKCVHQQELVIAGYTKPAGSRVGFGALLLGYYNEQGNLIYAGRVGTGFNKETLHQLTIELKKRRIDKSAFKNPPKGAEGRGVAWVKPELVGEVEFTEWTADGRLRHPAFHGLREDKLATEVVREMPVFTETKRSKSILRGKASSTSAKQHHTKAVAEAPSILGVRLTHPDRVLYPGDGYTKLDVAKYYERVADWILPHVANRPLTLVRCPEGIAGECFFQKHLSGTLDGALRTVLIQEKNAKESYLTIDDAAGLISLIQIGTLELHPWPAREDNVERPDYLVFDLDPGEDTAWKDVVRGARDLRELLETVGLKTFLRTSGGKGLHVVVPVDRRTSWDNFRQFAKSVAAKMSRQAPDRYIATMSKAKRHGKIFVDYLRNQRGATAIACFSTRCRPGAPVATPIAWEELNARLRPNRFNIRNLHRRLEMLKEDPWADFFQVRQSITAKIRDWFLE